MGQLEFLRHRKSSAVLTLASVLTTTNLDTTTDHNGSAINSSGFNSGVFLADVKANSSGTPDLILDVRIDTTTWAAYATIRGDLTTTAGTYSVGVTPLPDTIRVRLQPSTTTSAVRYTVKAVLKV